MLIQREEDIIEIIEKDDWMMKLLKIVKTLELPDWWICAGFVRSKIWDVLHDFESRTALTDIDVIYFDSINLNEDIEKEFEERLRNIEPNIPWSVKNQARMHEKNNSKPYSSSVDGISKFTETATALGVKLDDKNKVVLTAPWGIKDAIRLEVKPTPLYIGNAKMMEIYKERVTKKNWKSIWNKLNIEL